jgi:hypothetical protein
VLDQLVERDARLVERRACRGVQPEREQVVAELRADQVLGREIDDGAGLILEVRTR